MAEKNKPFPVLKESGGADEEKKTDDKDGADAKKDKKEDGLLAGELTS